MNKALPKIWVIVMTLAIITGGSLVRQCGWAQNDETPNWEVYQNEDYGFQIKYPSTFSLSFYKRSIAESDKPLLAVQCMRKEYENAGFHLPFIYIEVFNSALAPRQWIEKNYRVGKIPTAEGDPYHGRNKEIKESKINDYSVFRFQYFFASGWSDYAVFEGKNNLLIQVGSHECGNGSEAEIYRQMLSSFKLI